MWSSAAPRQGFALIPLKIDPHVDYEIIIALTAFVGACWFFDLRSRRVPNWLSFSATVMALALNVSIHGAMGLIHCVFGLTMALVVLLGPFVLGGLGGGDVKMMGAIGALLGPALTIQALAIGFVIGGLITLVHLAYLGKTAEVAGRTARMVASAITQRSLHPLRVDLDAPDAIALPYTLPLGIGSILAVILACGVWS